MKALTKRTVAKATAYEIWTAYQASEYPQGWRIEAKHFGGTGGSGSVLGVSVEVYDEGGRCIAFERIPLDDARKAGIVE